MPVPPGDRNAVEVELIETRASQQVSDGVKSGHYGYLPHSGELRVSSPGGTARVLPGTFVWIGGGQPRQLIASGPAAWTVFRVRNRVFSPTSEADRIAWETLMRLGKLGPKIPLEAKTIEAVGQLSEYMRAWADRESPIALPALKAALMELLVSIAEDPRYQRKAARLPGLTARSQELQRVLLLIDREAVNIPDAKALAARCGFSRSALYRLFQEAELPAPARMLEQARLEAATRMMRDTRRTILEVAMETGHHSLSAFYRSFARAFGQSPGQWRRSKHAHHEGEGNDG